VIFLLALIIGLPVGEPPPKYYRDYIPENVASTMPSMGGGSADIDQWVNLLDPKTPLGARVLGNQIARGRGWVGDDWRAIEAMFNSESFDEGSRTGWSYTAGPDRPGATALGFGQMVGRWHAPNRGVWPQDDPYRTDPRVQIEKAYDYIEKTYGTPSAAWEHWKSRPSAYFNEDWNRWVAGSY
jgi:hypothetical protein